MKKTKIICTVGPSTDSVELLTKMINAGMDMARFNFSHGDHAGHKKRIAMVREAAAKAGKPVALICDTKGPEMRLGMFKDNTVELVDGREFILTADDVLGDAHKASVNYAGLVDEVGPGNMLLLSDGMLSLKVTEIKGRDIHTVVVHGGEISSRKRVACPGVELKLPFLSKQDESDLIFAVENDMDYISASFVQNADNVFAIRKLLEAHNSDIGIISKIENRAGVEHMDDIIRASDGVMVARGDLGVEIPAAEVPMVQKNIIHACNKAGKPVITATQMLESMINSYRCTRAEASDIANSIFDGTDVIMLSGETASGKYPLEAVETMANIAATTEQGLDYAEIFKEQGLHERANSTEAICHAAVQISQEIHADAILSVTQTGTTARTMATYRSPAPVIAVTRDARKLRRLQLYWGVTPLLGPFSANTDEMIDISVQAAIKGGYIEQGDSVVITAGIPVGMPGSTNMIKVVNLGKKLLNGVGIGHRTVSGKVCRCSRGADFKEKLQKGDILVVDVLADENVKFATKAGAIIAEEGGLTSSTAIVSINCSIPSIVGATKATSLLADGMEVTVDTTAGIVYEGIVNIK
jgi:pyruvate kinase